MKKNIAIIYAVDDSGAVACERILKGIAKKYRYDFTFKTIAIECDDLTSSQTEKIVTTCLTCDVVLVAESPLTIPDKAVALYLEKLCLGIRNTMKLYANIVPIKNYYGDTDMDVLCVMDAAGGIYHGERGIRHGKLGREAFDTECYSEIEIERVARIAFEAAEKRSSKVMSIDKAELLSSELWRTALHDVASDYQNIVLDDYTVEEAIRKIMTEYNDVDVLVTTNLFGDIITAVAANISRSDALLPSCYVNDTTLGLYAPYRGSEGVGIKGYNSPIPAILASSCALRYSFELNNAADEIDNAVRTVMQSRFRTPDIAGAEDVVCSAERITEEVEKLL